MPNSKKKIIKYPTDFAEAQSFFEPIVADLSSVDDIAATRAYDRLAKHIYNYAKKLTRRDAVSELSIYLCRRERVTSVLDMDAFQLSLVLAMPGRFPPLSPSLRKALALKLAYAQKHDVKLSELENFLAKLPPVNRMKKELINTTPSVERDDEDVPRLPFKQRKRPVNQVRPVRRKPKKHRLEGSPSHKLLKAGARAQPKGPPISE